MIRLLVFALAIGLVIPRSIADTIHVPADSPTIQIAIQKAAPFDTIIVAPGSYFEAINFGGKVIVVQSENPNDPDVVASTIIDAGGLGSVVQFSGGEDQVNTILDGFTIRGGTIGIDAHESRAVIRRCIVRDNTSYGINNANGAIEDCQILNNNGAGMVGCDGAIRRCLLRANMDAGIYDCRGSIADSTIESTRGGGIGVYGGTCSITRCLIASNASTGIHQHEQGPIRASYIIKNKSTGLYGGFGLLENCIIAGNAGAGLQQSQKTIVSCTITGNRGWGIQNHTGTIRHVILWDNVSGPLLSSTTPVFSGSSNPFFVEPGYWDQLANAWVDGDYHLTPDSPYIDAGDPLYANGPNAPTQDIDGNPRIVGDRVDIGAYEFQAECDGDDFDGDKSADICDADIDDDGITNVTDKCDLTPAGIPVNAEGRPLADMNLDCEVNLHDYAVLQRSMTAP